MSRLVTDQEWQLHWRAPYYNLPVIFFVLLRAQFSREVLNFLMVKTDSKFWKISWKSDKTKAIQMEESNWADSCGGVYLWSPPSLWFSCRCSPSGRKKRGEGQPGAVGAQAAFKDSRTLSSPFTDLWMEWRERFSLYIYDASDLVFIEFKVNTLPGGKRQYAPNSCKAGL